MPQFDDTLKDAARRLVALALEEDFGPSGDVTSASLIPESLSASAVFLYKEDAVVAGLPVVREVCRQVDPSITLDVLVPDGEKIAAGTPAASLSGPARSLLAAERTAINFLSHLSGVATLTRRFVDAAANARVKVLDTRKTIPSLRALEKYAVLCGGGRNHRMGLYDQVLVKDNHLALLLRAGADSSLAAALSRIRDKVPTGTLIEVEAKTLEELRAALDASPDIVMLDNMPPALMREAVALVHARPGHRPLLEASGGVSLDTIAEIAATGVDHVSVGALTHSAPSVDISLEMK